MTALADVLRGRLGALELMVCLYDDGHDTLRIKHLSSGLEGAARLSLGDGISVGDRVTGWVASTNRRALNADAALDLHAFEGPASTPDLKCCSAFPLQLPNGSFAGVFTVYTAAPIAEEMLAYIELILPRISCSLYRASFGANQELDDLPRHLEERHSVEQRIRAAFGADTASVTFKTKATDPQPLSRDLLVAPDSPVLLTDIVLAGEPNQLVVISPRNELRASLPRWAQSKGSHRTGVSEFLVSDPQRLTA
jgi:hypothetical protein